VLYPFLGSFHEKSCSRHALRGVLFLVLTTPRLSRGRAVPSRGRGSESVGSSSEREMTRRTYVGMPREPLETPNEDDTMPTVGRARNADPLQSVRGAERITGGGRMDPTTWMGTFAFFILASVSLGGCGIRQGGPVPPSPAASPLPASASGSTEGRQLSIAEAVGMQKPPPSPQQLSISVEPFLARFLRAESCVLEGGVVTAKGIFTGKRAENYLRVGAVVGLYVYSEPERFFHILIDHQVAQLAGETPFAMTETGPWIVTVPVDPQREPAVRCEVTVRPFQKSVPRGDTVSLVACRWRSAATDLCGTPR